MDKEDKSNVIIFIWFSGGGGGGAHRVNMDKEEKSNVVIFIWFSGGGRGFAKLPNIFLLHKNRTRAKKQSESQHAALADAMVYVRLSGPKIQTYTVASAPTVTYSVCM